MTSLMRLFCRVDDFRGSNDYTAFKQDNRSRQIQPVAEFILNRLLSDAPTGEMVRVNG